MLIHSRFPKQRYRLITFDVYTALFDIESSLVPAAFGIFGEGINSLTFVRDWRRRQLEFALISNSLQQKRIPFTDITRRALDDTLARTDITLPDLAKAALLKTWSTLKPWPEAAEVITKLHTNGYTLGLLSNGDETQLHELSKQLPPVFDAVLSSEQAGWYKPHPSVYNLPLRSLGLKPDEILHVAGSPTDALGTKSAGLHCAWSNRKHEPHLDPNLPVDFDMPDLSRLLEILQIPP